MPFKCAKPVQKQSGLCLKTEILNLDFKIFVLENELIDMLGCEATSLGSNNITSSGGHHLLRDTGHKVFCLAKVDNPIIHAAPGKRVFC